ncbi:Gfo/Idh/MocA family protein [Pontivivens ytuae]|nr:Gfo/Idh/MocA family oxidoreductase [Pontivivens ytuae]
MTAPLKLGMVGGGIGGNIGAVHRIAARLDGRWVLVAGAFSSRDDVAHASAARLNVAPERSYADFREMAKDEAARPDGIDAVSIVTPNHMHAPVATAFLEAGIPVICDKPLTAQLDEAEALAEVVRRTGTPFVLTHNYTGYPLIREARQMVARGELGAIRVVQAEYAQDWLAKPIEQEGQKQAAWRTDPARSGAGGAIGDIGTHAFNLLSFVTGLRTEALSAQLTSFVPGRRLDDDAQMMLRFEGGARGMLWASQVAPGNENGLALRIYGEKAALEWRQEDPNRLRFSRLGEAPQWLTRAGHGTSAGGTRVPSGHPEGYLEAFATLYTEAAELIGGGDANLLPGIEDGLDGMRFIAACVASSQDNGAWTAL